VVLVCWQIRLQLRDSSVRSRRKIIQKFANMLKIGRRFFKKLTPWTYL
jgi:hypothetical protein